MDVVFDRSFEPMDVDLSLNSVKSMDISYENQDTDMLTSQGLLQDFTINENKSPRPTVEQPTVAQSRIKKYHVNLNKKQKSRNINLKYTSSVLVFFLSVIFYLCLNIKCCEKIDLMDLKQTLLKNLYGQDKAISNIISTLDEKVKTKILFFYGGTGVGKTFTSSLILEKIKDNSNIYHYTVASFEGSFTMDLMLGLMFCDTTFVIIDDLNIDNIKVNNYIRDLIGKSEYLRKNITLLLIYNSDTINNSFNKSFDDMFYIELTHMFSNIKATKSFIKFEPLTEKHLRKCIERELAENHKNVNVDSALKLFNVSFDGCKGVYTKMKFMKI